MDNKKFKPYVPAEKVTPELTVTSVLLGSILAVVFGAANAYLGLRVGMTISASIPAAVISMAVIRVILKKNSILENNMVQTIGSAGESLAAGAIFTLPALFLWAREEVMEMPSITEMFIVCVCGGMLGVLFMIPLRNALIVKEHGVLPYPEGTACATVLLAGEEGGADAKPVFIGMGVAALLKFLVDGVKVISGSIAAPIKALKTEVSAEVYPALIGVGYICGPKISAYMLTGGVIGWMVLIPAIVFFGGDTVLFPADVSIAELYFSGGASAIWENYIRYIGAGAVAAGGIISLCKSMPLIFNTFKDSIKSFKSSESVDQLRTNKNISSKIILIGIIILVGLLWILPSLPLSLPTVVPVVILGFFFATVSSRMVGLVGSSNNPVSGMVIATLLICGALLKMMGDVGAHGMRGAILIGSIISIIACMAADTSQDLKTGYILGATPKLQQIGEIIGTVVAAMAIGGVMLLLDKAWGFGSEAIPAPQATLMKMIVEGIMNDNLPWTLVFIGAFIAIAFEIIGIGSLPIAIGLYLPFSLSTTVMIGGIVRMLADRKQAKGEDKESSDASGGILFCSGMIAGEGLVGVLLAVFAVTGIDSAIDMSGVFSTGWIGALAVIIIMVFLTWRAATKKEC